MNTTWRPVRVCARPSRKSWPQSLRGSKDDATAAFKAAQPVIDTMVTKGIIHGNKAARHKRELNARIKALGAAAK